MAESKAKPTQYLGTGRRKTSVARVRLAEGTGQIRINGRTLEDFFTEHKDRNAVVGPLQVTEMRNRIDLTASVNGGGITGQAGAVCQGVALCAQDDVRPHQRRPRDRRREQRERDGQEAARLRLPHPRRPHEGTQEVRPQGRPQELPVLEALNRESNQYAQARDPEVGSRACAGLY